MVRRTPPSLSLTRMKRPAVNPQGIADVPVSVFRNIFAELVVDLFVDSPIVPGEPFSFSWAALTFSIARPLDLGTVTFSLYLVDQYENVDTGAQLYSATLSKSESATVTPGIYNSNRYAVTPTGDLAQRIYQVGTQVLRLVISGTGSDGPFESNDAGLLVRGEQVDSSWWEWAVPEDRTVQWKVDKYPVQGDLVNHSRYASITCTATMLETNLTDGDGIPVELGSDQPGAPAGPGQHAAISFGSIDFSKKWPWFIKGIFVPTGPYEREYSYGVRLDVVDAYQNSYMTYSTNILVDVQVSDQKIGAQSTAMGLMAGAAVELVAAAALACTPGGPILAAIGAGMAAAAQGIGVAADDPPVPSPSYRKLFEPVPIALPSNRELAGVLSTLRSVFQIIALVGAMGETDSRIYGAQRARKSRSERAQRSHYKRLQGLLGKEATRVRRLTPLAAKFLAAHRKFTPRVARGALVKWQRDPAERARIRAMFLAAGGTDDAFGAIDGFLQQTGAIDGAADSSIVIAWIGLSAERLAVASRRVAPVAACAVRRRKGTRARPR